MADKKTNNYSKSTDEALKILFDLFGGHLLSVSEFPQNAGSFKSAFLLQIDEPLLNLLGDKNISHDGKTIPAVLKDKADFQIYIITAREITAFADNFPLELVHIKNRYRKLFGSDPISEMSVDFNKLHNAAQISLQGILMHLRTAYLSQNYDDLFVAQIIDRISTVFESALFLRSQSIPIELCELVFKIENCYNPSNSVLSETAKKIESGKIHGIAENMLELIIALEKILAEIKGIVIE